MRLPAANVLEKLRNIWVLLRKKSGFLGSHGPRQYIANLAGSANAEDPTKIGVKMFSSISPKWCSCPVVLYLGNKIYAPTSPGAMGPLKSGTSVLPLVGITSTSFYALQCGQVTNTPLSLDTPVSPCPPGFSLGPPHKANSRGIWIIQRMFWDSKGLPSPGPMGSSLQIHRVFLGKSVVQPAFATSKHPFAEVVPFRLLALYCNVTFKWNIGFAKTQSCKCFRNPAEQLRCFSTVQSAKLRP